MHTVLICAQFRLYGCLIRWQQHDAVSWCCLPTASELPAAFSMWGSHVVSSLTAHTYSQTKTCAEPVLGLQSSNVLILWWSKCTFNNSLQTFVFFGFPLHKLPKTRFFPTFQISSLKKVGSGRSEIFRYLYSRDWDFRYIYWHCDLATFHFDWFLLYTFLTTSSLLFLLTRKFFFPYIYL